MKNALRIVCLVLLASCLSVAQQQAQLFQGAPPVIGGKFIASAYASWSVHSTNTIAAGSATMTLDNCYPKMGANENIRAIFPFNVNTPVTIIDGSNTETALTLTSVTTPTANTASSVNPFSCSITATFANAHSGGVTIVSGDNGLGEAINDASATGGVVVIDPGSGITTAQITGTLAYYSNVTLEDDRSGSSAFYALQPTTLTALATPATRSATAGATQVVSGTATGTWTAVATYVCVTYVDILGGESPCSASYNFTATVNVALNFAAPAASTGAVGWRAYAGVTGTSTQYQLPISASTCTLSTLTPYATCAMGAPGVFTSPTTATALAPAAGGVAATYRPNTQSHTTFGYEPVGSRQYVGMQSNYGPFIISPALTAGQSVVLGTVPVPTGLMNYIGRTLRVTGKITVTPSTGGSFQLIAGIGDTTDFSTGTPKALCTLTSTGTITTAAQDGYFQCDLTVNATGTTGTIMPSGFSIWQVQAGAATSPSVAVESATGAITADVLDPSTLDIEFLQTSAAESITPPQLQILHLEVL